MEICAACYNISFNYLSICTRCVVCMCVCHRLINLVNSKGDHNSIKFIWKRLGKSINFVDEAKHNLFTLIFFPNNEVCSQHQNTLNNPNVWIWQSNSLAVAILLLIVSFNLFFVTFFSFTMITFPRTKFTFEFESLVFLCSSAITDAKALKKFIFPCYEVETT